MKAPFQYYGGKMRLGPRIAAVLPPHDVYVEPFCGSAAVLFAKERRRSPSKYKEVVNDVDGEIVNFFRVLRDRPREFVDLVDSTPYARAEYDLARATWRGENSDEPDALERARRFVVLARRSFGGRLGAGWSRGVGGNRNHANTWARAPEILRACADRLRGVYVEDLDCLDRLRRWDSRRTCFYLDPPYPGAYQGHYAGYELADLRALVRALDAASGTFVLSNYAQTDVEFPANWRRVEIDVYCATARDRRRTEVLWIRGEAKRVPRVKVLAIRRPKMKVLADEL